MESKLLGEQRINRGGIASLALHLSLLGLLLIHRQPHVMPPEQRGDRNGHLLSLTFDPGLGAPAAALHVSKAPPLPPKPQTPTLPSPAFKPQPPVAVADTTSAANTGGSDALGSGDMTLALVLVHPYPSPNLSPLPSGTSGDVVVDVVIDKAGLVAKYSLVRGLGHGIDDTVIATIQTWTFKPATRNGTPVASEQELLFHYERS
jgi:protein TonB